MRIQNSVKHLKKLTASDYFCKRQGSEYLPYKISPVFWSNTWKYNIEAKERLAKVKEKRSTIQFDIFALAFSSFQCLRQYLLQTEVARAIFYTHQTSGACTGVCSCDRTHLMDKTGMKTYTKTDSLWRSINTRITNCI